MATHRCSHMLKDPFTSDEDRAIHRRVTQEGTGIWESLHKELNRSITSICYRWLEMIQYGQTDEEDSD